MPRFCANITTLFTELPLTERPAAAAAAGFEAVEVLFPYDDNAAELKRAIAAAGLPLALINCPPPNYTDEEGPRGFAAVPGGQERFRYDFRRALRYARTLGAERIHLMAGVAEGPEAGDAFAENLSWAVEEAPEQLLTIEPLNPGDMPGYFLDDFALAMAVIEEIGAPNLYLQFDAYHAQKITGDLAAAWASVAPTVGHVQVGGLPDRHEPDGPEMTAFLQALDRQGYTGWVSGEYTPRGRTADGLGWIRRF